MRHPRLLQRPEGRENLFRSVCHTFAAGKECTHGAFCKYLHLGRRTPVTTHADTVVLHGQTQSAAAAANKAARAAAAAAAAAAPPPPPQQQQQLYLPPQHQQQYWQQPTTSQQYHQQLPPSFQERSSAADVAAEIERAVSAAAVSADLDDLQERLQAVVLDRLIAAGGAPVPLRTLAVDDEVRGIALKMHELRPDGRGLAGAFLASLAKMQFVVRQGTDVVGSW